MILRTPPPARKRRADSRPPEDNSPNSDRRLFIYEDPPVPELSHDPTTSEQMLCTYQCRQMVMMTESIPMGRGEEEMEKTSACVAECEPSSEAAAAAAAEASMVTRKDKRKAMKKEKRKQKRKELAEKAHREEEALLNDPEEQRKIQLEEEREKEREEREKREFEERERLFFEALAAKRKIEQEEEERKALEEEEQTRQNQVVQENALNEDDNWEYVEEGPPEIIWQGNEIIVKKKKVRVKKKDVEQQTEEEDADRPSSNPLPPQSEAFSDYKNASLVSAQELLDNVAQQIPNFGTEQDKAHCPFHLKTGACRFGSRCSRVHFYPDKSCTLLIKNMYNGPGLTWEQDEGLEYTDEEVEHSYEEFYEDVHTEFLKFGEIVNFKVCRNGSFHLRGNVYVHYKSLDSAVLAFHSINGRYFAGKQVKCEFVNVTKWKVAICGEYMKSRLKTCSHGSACNFIHCFRNPGGDYEWADWDKQPPKYWMKKMAVLFGYFDEPGYDKLMEHERHLRNSSKMLSTERDSSHFRRSVSRETDYLDGTSRRHHEEHDLHWSQHRQWYTCDGRKQKMLDGKTGNDRYSKKRTHVTTDSDQDFSDKDRDEHHGSPRKRSRHQIKESDSRDYCGDRKGRIRQTNSYEELFDRGRDSDEHRSHRRRTLEHRKVSEMDDNDNKKNRTQGIGFGGDWLKEDRHTSRDRRGRRKGSRHQSKLSVSPDDHYECRTQDSDLREDGSDEDRDRCHGHSRKWLMHSSEALKLPGDHGKSEEVLKNKFIESESKAETSELHSLQKYDHSRGKDHLGTETSVVPDEHVKSICKDEISNSRSYGHRVGSCDLDSTYDSCKNIDKVGHCEPEKGFSKRHRKPKSTWIGDQNFDLGGPYQYDGRHKSHDSGHSSEEDVEKRGRWEPDKRVSEEHPKSGKKYRIDDHEQFTGKSNSGHLRSDEFYSQRTSRHSRSSHRKHSNRVDELGFDKEVQEFNSEYREDRKSHGQNQHNEKNSSLADSNDDFD